MSGLVATDDSTITVKLSQPEADWSLRLGYSAFFPLPSAALADPTAYGENPVGNGPYKFAKTGAWVHDQSISLVKNTDYSGPREAKNGGVTFKFYTDPGPAYTDLQSDNLDVTDVLPSNALKTFVTDFPDRNAAKPVATNATLNIPQYNANFQGEAESSAGRPCHTRSIAKRSPKWSSAEPARRQRLSYRRSSTASRRTSPVAKS